MAKWSGSTLETFIWTNCNFPESKEWGLGYRVKVGFPVPVLFAPTICSTTAHKVRNILPQGSKQGERGNMHIGWDFKWDLEEQRREAKTPA